MTHDTLIQTLIECEMHCRICTQHCANAEDNYAHRPIQRLSIECADFCNIAMRLLIMDSSYSVRAVEVCSVICNDFAIAYSSYPQRRYRQCAMLCQETAELCDRFVLEQMWTGNKFPVYINYN